MIMLFCLIAGVDNEKKIQQIDWIVVKSVKNGKVKYFLFILIFLIFFCNIVYNIEYT